MSHEATIHPAQSQILRELLFVQSASFAGLQKPTGLESDHFKFHIKRLLDIGYVQKTNGHYQLTSQGKEYANKLDTDKSALERQPKVAVILVAQKGPSLLVQERLKHPYFGFWGFPGGKIRWGETIMQAAARELYEETGLNATLTYRGVYHEHVLQAETGALLEDKIFHIIYCINPQGSLKPRFEGGANHWLTRAAIKAKPKIYRSFDTELQIGLGEATFVELAQQYREDQF